MTAKLSNAAESTLLAAHARIGAKPTNYSIPGKEELARQGMLSGVDGGLTRKGVIARERIVSARLDEAF